MIEIISSILEAEKKADEIVDSANKESQKIRSDGDTLADKKIAEATSLARIKRKNKLDEAGKMADSTYNEIVKKTTVDADKMINDAHANLKQAEQYILDRVFNLV